MYHYRFLVVWRIRRTFFPSEWCFSISCPRAGLFISAYYVRVQSINQQPCNLIFSCWAICFVLLYCISLSTADAGPQRARLPIQFHLLPYCNVATLPVVTKDFPISSRKDGRYCHTSYHEITSAFSSLLPSNPLGNVQKMLSASTWKMSFICVVVSKGRCLRVILLHLKQIVLLSSVDNTSYAPYPLGLLICLYAVTALT